MKKIFSKKGRIHRKRFPNWKTYCKWKMHLNSSFIKQIDMKGLDSWIMGINDPNAPFNQHDWVEFYEPILNHCEWITDDMLENDATYEQLENIFDKVYMDSVGDGYIPRREILQYLKNNAKKLSELVKHEYELLEKKSL